MAKAPTAREKGFMEAVEALWGEGEWRDRRVAYMKAMERLYQQFPKTMRSRPSTRCHS